MKKTELLKAMQAYELQPKAVYMIEVLQSSGLTMDELYAVAQRLWQENAVTVHFVVTDGRDFSLKAVPAKEGE